MLRDSSGNMLRLVAVVRTRPQVIPLTMITKRKSTNGFPFLSYMSMGLRYKYIAFFFVFVFFFGV